MNLGTVVTLNGKGAWVLVECYTKRNAGVTREKRFIRLRESPNYVHEFKPFTHKRAAEAKEVEMASLLPNQYSEWNKYRVANFKLWMN